MKFIFDFDDVLFYTTKKLRERIYSTLGKVGILRDPIKSYFERERWNNFSLKKMLTYFSVSKKLYEEIMKESKNFVNKELLRIIKKIDKSDCYIITYGDEKFQQDKIRRTGIAPFFSSVLVTSGSKKNAIEGICNKYKEEKVLFIDDKSKHFEDLDMKKYPNLKTILYDEHGLEKLKKEINNNQ